MTALIILLIIFFIWSRYDQYLSDKAIENDTKDLISRLNCIIEELEEIKSNQKL